MKKLFILFALVTGTMGTFANTTVAEFNDDFGTCTIVVTQTNSDGEVTGTAIHTVYGVNSQAECDSEADMILTLYKIGSLQMK